MDRRCLTTRTMLFSILLVYLARTTGLALASTPQGSALNNDGVPLLELESGDQDDSLFNVRSAKGERSSQLNKRSAWAFPHLRWTYKTIWYTFKRGDFTRSQLRAIRRGMAAWQEHTCIRFDQKQLYNFNYILIRDGPGCSSTRGMMGGRQPMYLGDMCFDNNRFLQQLGLAIGLYWHHQRSDRDQYVTIHLENVDENKWRSFRKLETTNTLGVPFDYTSVMQRNSTFFSNNTLPTIVPRNSSYTNTMGRGMLKVSFLDIKAVNLLYSCAGRHCDASVQCPEHGFKDRRCNCKCPGSRRNPVIDC